jgi:hypothetical protein
MCQSCLDGFFCNLSIRDCQSCLDGFFQCNLTPKYIRGNLPIEQFQMLAEYCPKEGSKLRGTNSNYAKLILRPEIVQRIIKLI